MPKTFKESPLLRKSTLDKDQLFSNNCSISILYLASKLTERFVKSRHTDYFYCNNLLTSLFTVNPSPPKQLCVTFVIISSTL